MRSLLLSFLLIFCFVGYGQIINFPDANFKNALVNTKCVDLGSDGNGDADADSNNDGEIDISEVLKVERLNVSNQNILSLEGINSFKNLNYLICNSNKLVSLDLQELTNLTSLTLGGNQLNSLNIKGLMNLEFLACGDNQLTSLDVGECTNLKSLYCNDNQLKSLNVLGLTNLDYLYCNNNQLTSLDLLGLESLTILNCSLNKLTSLNVQFLTNLEYLYCINNQLTLLKIKGANIFNHLNLDFFDNPNLTFICCDEKIITLIKNRTLSLGLNCEVNSYCSFTPGGKFYILNGENAFDRNNNGCDEQDIKWPNLKYKLYQDNNLTGLYITNSTGNYSIPVQAGTHTITPILEYPDYFEVTPTSYTVTFPTSSDTITQDFCITPKGIFRQTNITVIPLFPPARPGFDASYKIVWENVGNQIENGTLNFTYNETILNYISATQTADQVADGIIKWNFTNLLPFEKREITVTLKVNRPTDTPAVNAGDKLYLTASILDNIFTLENTVVGSYDPNDKTCLQGDRVKPDMVGEYVDYLIRFENTGNYAAENVVVKDIIDTKTFDVSTLQITDASHEVYTRIEGNKVEFIFENIQLPFDDANNDGYIAFKIKTLPTLVLGDSLKNLADIYFDYNFPIRTNEAQTTIALPVFTKDLTTDVNIYPNPVTDVLYLDTNENWSKADIYDIAGRIIRSVSLYGQSIDVSGLESGTYFVRLKDGDRVGVVKFVKI
jgi:uncharacterized repeat protein (TIGR01451 family)